MKKLLTKNSNLKRRDSVRRNRKLWKEDNKIEIEREYTNGILQNISNAQTRDDQ